LFQRDSGPLPSGSRDTKDKEGEPLPRFLLRVLHVPDGGKIFLRRLQFAPTP